MNGTTVQTLHVRSPFKIACLAALFLLVAFTIGNQVVGIGKTGLLWWTDLWWTLISFAAALLCLDVARRPTIVNQRAWFFFSLGCFSWALGMVAWDIYELVFQWVTPFPSLADVGYSAFALLILVGCFFLANVNQSIYERSKLVLDSMILINVLALALAVFFHDAISQSRTSLTGKITALFYPIVPLSVSYVLWTARSRIDAGAHRQSLDWVLAGMLLMTSANMGYLVPIITGGYAVGSSLDPLWIGAFLCIGLGALKIRYEDPSFSEATAIEK